MTSFIIEIHGGWFELAVKGHKLVQLCNSGVLECRDGNHLSCRLDISTVSFYWSCEGCCCGWWGSLWCSWGGDWRNRSCQRTWPLEGLNLTFLAAKCIKITASSIRSVVYYFPCRWKLEEKLQKWKYIGRKREKILWKCKVYSSF